MSQKDGVEQSLQNSNIDKKIDKKIDEKREPNKNFNTSAEEFTNREFYKENESQLNDKQYIGELSDEELEKISGGSATSHKRYRC